MTNISYLISQISQLKCCVAQLQNGGGGGGESLFPLTGTGTATGNVIGDLGGHDLQINYAGNNFLEINSDPGNESSTLNSANGTGFGSFGLFTNPGNYVFGMVINDGSNGVEIIGNATDNTLESTASTQTFNVGNVFKVVSGFDGLFPLLIDTNNEEYNIGQPGIFIPSVGITPQALTYNVNNNDLYGVTDDVIYNINLDGTSQTVLHTFSSPDGLQPLAPMVLQDDIYYGTTSNGSTTGPLGVLYSFDPNTNTYTKLYDMGLDGLTPGRALLVYQDTLFYGVTSANGGNPGVIYSFDPSDNTFTILHTCLTGTGTNPVSTLIFLDGLFYGTTQTGGTSNRGVIYSFDPSDSTYTVLINFQAQGQRTPVGDLVYDSDSGLFYGITTFGGTHSAGIIYSFNPIGNVFTTLFNFATATGSLARAITLQDGILYGVTSSGGASGAGVIFSFNPSGNVYADIHDFDVANGQQPMSAMVYQDGLFYGVTPTGGTYNAGILYSINPSDNTFTNLFTFHPDEIPIERTDIEINADTNEITYFANDHIINGQIHLSTALDNYATGGFNILARNLDSDKVENIPIGNISLLPAQGSGVATGDIIGGLGNSYTLTIGGDSDNPCLFISPITNVETSTLAAFNTTGGGNKGYFTGATTDTSASFNLLAGFDINGVNKFTSIVASSTTTGSIVAHTLDDGTGSVILALSTDSGAYSFDLKAFDGVNTAEIIGDGVAGALAFNGLCTFSFLVVMTGLPSLSYPDDATAAGNGIPVGGLYNTAGVVKVRLT